MDRVAEFHFRRPPKPRCRPKSRGFRQRVGNPYFEDSHRLTPKTGRLMGVRYDHLNDASDEAELGDSLDDSVDLSGGRDETVKDQIRRLSYDEAERDGGQYLEIRTHFSLDKDAEFESKRYHFDASLQWSKRFNYEIWYRQLPKKTQQCWSLLSEAFLDYYCSQFDQSAHTRYYSVRRKANEPICDFLIRLNEYARTAKIQYEKGGADTADHVEQFLLKYGVDGIIDLLCPLQLADIQRAEQIINNKLLGEIKEEAARLPGSQPSR
ncbi:unnamed protein product [Phytophthora fragariaefolia]|uniref:Unnamed protein product n=1 Tax=Phytophthora fragariaefolia TaxID=1490495 RepID=A0A9W6U322_9STRA|nr:unnamed protein product [Phytophthora fragariaefolia]